MAAVSDLPHVYPFRFVDTVLRPPGPDFSGGSVCARISAGARAAMGGAWASPALLAEAIAQAALLLEGGNPEAGRRGFLAGIEGFEIPHLAGENVRQGGQFLPLHLVQADPHLPGLPPLALIRVVVGKADLGIHRLAG